MRNRQGITIAALIIAIIGLSIGFAAFSNTLTIRSSATVNPDQSALRVVFSLDDDSEVVGTTGSVTPNSNTYGDAGTIDNTQQGNSKIEGLHAKFTEPGQSVKYNVASANLYVYNAGSLQAQLTGVTFNNAQGVNTYKKCTAVTENKETSEIATDSLVQAACADITISVKVGNKAATPADTSLNYQILGVGASLPAEITITYGGSTYVDGDFEVSFGDVVINATSAVNPALVVVPNYTVGEIYNGDYISKTAGVLTGYRGSSTDIVIPDSLPLVEQTSVTYNEDKCADIEEMAGLDGICVEIEKYLGGEEYDSSVLVSDMQEAIDDDPSLVADAVYQVVDATEYNIISFNDIFMSATSVTFNSYITTIPAVSFSNLNITELDIPSNIIEIGHDAFGHNPLTNGVRIHNNEADVQIGDYAFPSGTEIVFDDKTITYGE